jgi:hypothetical protein
LLATATPTSCVCSSRPMIEKVMAAAYRHGSSAAELPRHPRSVQVTRAPPRWAPPSHRRARRIGPIHRAGVRITKLGGGIVRRTSSEDNPEPHGRGSGMSRRTAPLCRLSVLTPQTCPDRPSVLHTTGAGDAAEATPPARSVDQGTTVMRSVAVGVVGEFAVM